MSQTPNTRPDRLSQESAEPANASASPADAEGSEGWTPAALREAITTRLSTYIKVKPAPLCPELQLYQAPALTPLWEATEALLQTGPLPPPYWAFCWPGSAALARYLLDHPEQAQGRRVLDFAAGGGAASIAALRTGARRVLATELDPLALACLEENAHLNARLNGLDTRPLETRAEDLLQRAPLEMDLILAGDVCYEQAMSAQVLAWLHQAAARGTRVLMGDPGRGFPPGETLQQVAHYTVPTNPELEGQAQMETRVLAF